MGHTRNVYTPVAAPGLPAPILDVACGRSHTVVCCADGSVWAAGDATKGQLGVNKEDAAPVCKFTACRGLPPGSVVVKVLNC